MTRDLSALFDPRSVAVVGASNVPGKWGFWLARGAIKGEGRRSVYLVNRKGGEIFGRRAYTSLDELPEPPEFVVITVPAAGLEEAVEDSLAAGAKALVAISAGLGEMGSEGAARERAIVERVRAAGAVLVGPNCLGVYDAEAGFELCSEDLEPGSIGLISQSGNLALEIGLLAADFGLGFSRFVSLGNQADVEAAELVEAYAAHEPTRLIAVYLEDFRDGRAFARAASAAVAAGKPVVLLAGGATEASARAARSHTGALASDLVAIEAAAVAAGIELVRSPKEVVDLAQALLAGRRPQGRRVALAADGGGHTVVASDLVSAEGLDLPALSAGTRARLAEALPPTATLTNPIDFAGGGEQDISSFAKVARALLESGEVDAALVTGYFGGYSQYSEEFGRQEVETARGMALAAEETGRPLLVHTMYWRGAAAEALRANGVPVFREVEAAVWAAGRLARSTPAALRGVPQLPEPAPPVAGEQGYFAARTLLAAAGIEFVEAREVAGEAEAPAAAAELGYPVVLKALGRLHKSDAGGVAVGLRDERELEEALARMAAALAPPGYSVERLAPAAGGVELIVGARRDPRFGPLLLVGAGGLFAETAADVAVALAPAGEEAAEALLASLRVAPLLHGARGRTAVDVRAAARAAAALSRVAAEHPEIAEIEINPLLVGPDGALGLDARAVLAERGDDDAR
ncbi:MAG TPA: acetate--CoA ligase family protein [Gaiellaceae bacterium]|nr:acetate--CoA ligase family protein [Gaiellaceae bacterium]